MHKALGHIVACAAAGRGCAATANRSRFLTPECDVDRGDMTQMTEAKR